MRLVIFNHINHHAIQIGYASATGGIMPCSLLAVKVSSQLEATLSATEFS